MHRFLVFLLSFLVVFLAGCEYIQIQQGKNISLEQIEPIPEQENSPLNGYTGDVIVISEGNSGDIVIQTGDQLLYRNEIYGFQVLLGREWKGGKICKGSEKGIDFFLSGETNERGELIQNQVQDKNSCRPLGYTPYGHIEIFTHEAYLKHKQESEQFHNGERTDITPYRINNRFRFRFIQAAFGKTLKLLLPTSKCNNIVVPAGEGEVAYQLYSCSEIENSQLILSGFSTFDL